MLSALLLVLMGLLGFFIAHWITSTGPAYWRAVAGFAVAFMFAWVGGVVLSASVFAVIGSVDIAAITTSFLGKGFWYALVGAGYGVYKGRVKLGSKVRVDSINRNDEAHPHYQVVDTNDHYAEALAEIEEGRLEKGVWARAFADAGGEAEKAKALYIRARAEALKDGEVWEDTQPSVADERDANIPAAQAKYGFFRTAGRMYGILSARHLAPGSWLGVGVVVLASVLAIYAYLEYGRRQVEAVTEPESQPTVLARPAPEVDWSPYTPENQKILQDQQTQRDRFGGTLVAESLTPENRQADQNVPNEAKQEHYGSIYAAHPDADQIASSAAFQAWVARSPEHQRILKAGTAQEVVRMFSAYKKQNQVQRAAIQSPKVFFKCTGPNGVVYQATPCNATSN